MVMQRHLGCTTSFLEKVNAPIEFGLTRAHYIHRTITFEIDQGYICEFAQHRNKKWADPAKKELSHMCTPDIKYALVIRSVSQKFSSHALRREKARVSRRHLDRAGWPQKDTLSARLTPLNAPCECCWHSSGENTQRPRQRSARRAERFLELRCESSQCDFVKSAPCWLWWYTEIVRRQERFSQIIIEKGSALSVTLISWWVHPSSEGRRLCDLRNSSKPGDFHAERGFFETSPLGELI
jgi:hypothetical protein